MSISTTVKQQLIKQIQDHCPSVQEIYGHQEMAPKGWPSVFVTATGMSGEFISNLENSRVYSFQVIVVFPIAQDMPGLPSGTNRLEYAEQTIATVVDEIINAVDTDFELDGTPVLYVNAADAAWGEAAVDIGIVKAVQITLNIYTEYRTQ